AAFAYWLYFGLPTQGTITWPRSERRKRPKSNASEQRRKASLKSGPPARSLSFRLLCLLFQMRRLSVKECPLRLRLINAKWVNSLRKFHIRGCGGVIKSGPQLSDPERAVAPISHLAPSPEIGAVLFTVIRSRSVGAKWLPLQILLGCCG